MKMNRSSVRVEGEVKEEEEEVDGGEEQRLRIVNLVCNAVDHDEKWPNLNVKWPVNAVESRAAAIVAIGDGHMASATSQLQLMMSNFPEHIRKMPLEKFVKQHCPCAKAKTRSDGTLFINFVQDPAVQPPGGAIPDVSTALSSVQKTPGS